MNLYFKYILRVLFIIALIYLIYILVFSEKNINILQYIDQLVSKSFIYKLIIVFILQFLNWGIEAKKFQFILSKKKPVKYINSYKAIYSGAATAIFTPDRLGNFIGRFVFFKGIDKRIITAATLLGNLSQLISTISFAFIGLLLTFFYDTQIEIPYINNKIVLVPVAIVLVIALYIFFYPSVILKFIKRIKIVKQHESTFNFLGEFNSLESFQILLFSLSRYVVFILQFYILLHAVNINITPIETICFTGMLYLYTTLIPSPVFGNLGTREVIAILLMSNFYNGEMVLIASLLLWLINIVIPSVIGSFFLLKMNKIKK